MNDSKISGFLALLFRQKYIARWGLMRSSYPESLSDHSFETAVVAHCLAMLENSRHGGSFDADKAAVIALYHDASEVYTGDLPTPVKYHDAALRDSYKKLEESAAERLISKLPDDIAEIYRKYLIPQDERYIKLVKAADKLCALIKCMEEEKTGSGEFHSALKATEASLDSIEIEVKSVGDFRRDILPAFMLTLDEL